MTTETTPNITLPPRERAWVEQEANETDTSPNSVVTRAVRAYQLFLLGHLIESEDYKAMRSMTP